MSAVTLILGLISMTSFIMAAIHVLSGDNLSALYSTAIGIVARISYERFFHQDIKEKQ